MRALKSALLRLPMRLALFAGMAALFAFAATTVSAGLIYNPVVVVISGTTASGTGDTTSISIYRQGVAGQVAPVSTTAYNSSASGTRLVTSGSDAGEGTLTNNPGVSDAAAKGMLYGGTQYVYNGGYDATGGTAFVKDTMPPDTVARPNAPRAFGQANVTGRVASGATVLQTQPSVGTGATYVDASIRGAVGDDTGGSTSSGRYTAGTTNTGSSFITSGGFRNFGAGTLLTTPVNTTNGLHNTRTIELLGGNLFGTSGNSTTRRGIYKLNPAGAAVSATDEPRYLDTGSASGPNEFALFDDPNLSVTLNMGYDTAYIADDRTDVNGGIQKWTWNGAVWSLAYTLKDAGLTTPRYRGLAGQLDAATGLITLYTTFTDASSNTGLQQVTDTGAGSSFMTLASLTAASGSSFHGVALSAPEPSALLLAILACGAISCATGRRRFVD